MFADLIPLRLAGMMASRRLGMRHHCLFAALLEAVGIGLAAVGPLVLKLLVDVVGNHKAAPVQLVWLVAAFVLSWSGSSLISSVRAVFSGGVTDAMAADMTLSALRGSLPATSASRDGDSGRVSGLIERLPFNLQIVVDGLVWRAVPLILQIVISLVLVSCLIPPRYAVVLAAVFVGFVAATWLGAVWYKGPSLRANAAASDVSQIVGDILRNARRVVFNGALDLELSGVREAHQCRARAGLDVAWSLVLFSGAQYLVIGIGLLFLLTQAGGDVTAGRMTAGDFVLLQAYAFRLALPLSSFGFTLSQAGIAIANIRDVIDLFPCPCPAQSSVSAMSGPANISVRNLGFHYEPGAAGLSEVSVDFPASSFSVIVGSNGSGKSTFAQLIAGILEPGAGEIKINGIDLAIIPRSERHRFALYVPQFIGLFNRTLADNALYPPTRHSEGTLNQVLEDWRFADGGLPVQFSAPVGEQGERLSGGQIQKLELARLIGVEVPAIILDESTSALDVHSEWQVIDALRKCYGAKTTMILITHRLRMAEVADQVLYVANGRLVAVGAHTELLERLPNYQSFWS